MLEVSIHKRLNDFNCYAEFNFTNAKGFISLRNTPLDIAPQELCNKLDDAFTSRKKQNEIDEKIQKTLKKIILKKITKKLYDSK